MDGDTALKRAGIGPRRMARGKTARYLLRPWILISGLGASCLVVVIILGTRAAQEAWFDKRAGPMFTGFLLGGGLVSVPWAIWALALSADGSVSWRIGADAEQWTARELHALGSSWRFEHNVPFPENGYVIDVDHVALGPYGVLAVETKWTSAAVDLGAKRLVKDVRDAIRQAESNAGRVRGLLRRVADVDVTPVVVFWGREVKPPVPPVRREGQVRIVAGSQADLWRQNLKSERVDPQMVSQLSDRVHRWLVDQEEKLTGVGVRRRLKQARWAGRVSMTATAAIALLFPIANASASFDRLLGSIFAQGGGAVGLTIFFAPLLLGVWAVALVYVARRLDPTIPRSRGTLALLVWLAGFGALWLRTQ